MGLASTTHAAHSDLIEDVVVRNGQPDQRWGIRHLAFILGRARGQVNDDSVRSSVSIALGVH